jgi:TrmH family RNA methyltransferase
MLTKGRIQAIKSFSDKKHRNAKGVFVVEGAKSVAELLTSELIIEELYVTHEFAKKYEKEMHAAGKYHASIQKYLKPQFVEAGELKQMSSLEATDSALAVVKQMKVVESDPATLAKTGMILLLEDIRDPGNLGTIIRTADWYGITHIYASIGTVDMYNNKTIISSMGSYARVTVTYGDIRPVIEKLYKNKIAVVGSVLTGENSHAFAWPKAGALVIGNEASGITTNTLDLIEHVVTIPSFGKAESLNAGVATAILLDEWRRSSEMH